MTHLFKPGQVANLCTSGLACEVEQYLGGGGQGEVYRAKAGTKSVALKWYFAGSATPLQQAALHNLVKIGPPSGHFQFWPLELATAARVPGFGYIMPLREPRFKSIVDLMKNQVDCTFRCLTLVGLNLAHGYLQLHSKGLCYRDISFGNAFFDPKTGEVLICDNDNVAVDGQDSSGVLGTPRFMAPEIVRGEAMPSTQTDLYSLAVLLFYIFMVHHPLDGRKEAMIRSMDVPAMVRLYGAEPVFIFDPSNDSNRPVPGLHDNALAFWPLYPGFLRQLFTRAFTNGIRDPKNGRVRESEWRVALAALRDCIVSCPACAKETFFDFEAVKRSAAIPCWACKKPIGRPMALQLDKLTVALGKGSRLYPHHLDEKRLYDFSAPTAEVVAHPSDPNLLGLKNLTADKWVGIMPDGKLNDVPTGRSVRLAPGIKIQFGKIEGVIDA